MFDSLMSSEFDLKKDIIRFGQRLAERQMVAGSDGNISARIDETQIVITPSGFAKGRLEIDDLVVVDMSGR
ncbi:MAG: class II aldolase/adducin family protein, partial [candidate division Zixibacteria bacterium]|nr:class II aldolase/adducin family protein [candidate division Zixibacteria bacterium]